MNEQIVMYARSVKIPIEPGVGETSIPGNQTLEKAPIYGFYITVAENAIDENGTKIITRAEAANGMLTLFLNASENALNIPLTSAIMDGKPYSFFKFYSEGFNAENSKIKFHKPFTEKRSFYITFIYDLI